MKLITTVRSKLENIEDNRFRSLNSPDFRVKMAVAQLDGEQAIIRATCLLDCTPEEALAYSFQIMSRKRMRLNNKKDTIERQIWIKNEHSFDYKRE